MRLVRSALACDVIVHTVKCDVQETVEKQHLLPGISLLSWGREETRASRLIVC